MPRPLKIAAWGLLVVVLGLAVTLWRGYSLMHQPGSQQGPVLVHITPGSSVRKVAATLHAQGVLAYPSLFEAYVRARGLSTRIQAGEYEIPGRASQASILDLMVDGSVYLHPITIVEGWTWYEMVRRLSEHPVLVDDISAHSADEMMGLLGRPGEHPEGRFFPDTYHFARDTPLSRVLRLAMARMDQELARAWEARDRELPVQTPYQALVLASIVEKETALASERPAIAGVFSRRLQRRMRLQTDPTVIYGLGPAFDGNLRRSDLERDGPYNSYTRAGLPPTPICLPGAEALAAATRPAAGDALYFVATGEADGSHYFSTSLEEHNKAVARYLKRLRQNRGRK